MKHFIASILSLAMSSPSSASSSPLDHDYDVSIFSAGKDEVIEIRIGKCVTKFPISKKDFAFLSENPEVIQQMVISAHERKRNGCKQ